MQSQLLINGQLVTGQGEPLPVYNPATGEVLLQIPEATVEQVNSAVSSASAAFDSWSQTVPRERAEKLLALAAIIEQHAQTFARLESQNCGKPFHAVLNDEIPAVADVFRFFCRSGPLPEWFRCRRVSGRAYIHDSP